MCSPEESLQTIKWKYSAMKKKGYGSNLAWLVFCLALVIPRHSLDNLKAGIVRDGEWERVGS